MKKHTLASILIGALLMPGAALADRPPAGPDFDEGRPARADRDRTLVASDSDRPIAPTDIVTFGLDSAALTPGARDQVATIAAWLGRHPGARVAVEGYTDRSGTEIYNLGLAAQRGTAVRDALVAQGVDVHRVSVVAYGEAQALAEPSASRRVVIYATLPSLAAR